MKSAKKRSPRGKLRPGDAKKFLAAFKEAWEKRSPELAANLFTRDAHYWQEPFGEAIVSREAICHHWKQFTKEQDDVHFTVHNFFHSGYSLVAEWSCTYTARASGEQVELAGVLVGDFYGQQARTLRQYILRRS